MAHLTLAAAAVHLLRHRAAGAVLALAMSAIFIASLIEARYGPAEGWE